MLALSNFNKVEAMNVSFLPSFLPSLIPSLRSPPYPIMTGIRVSVVFLLLTCLTWRAVAWSNKEGDDYVKEACNVTHYQDLCIHSLSPFSNSAKRDPQKWARAAVSVTVGEAKMVTQYLTNQKKDRFLRGNKERLMALSDCIECFQDSLDNLHKSLGELRSLNSSTFDGQMENVETWMSAALTGEDTCLDGFNGCKGKEVKYLCNEVLNVTYLTSNALALVDKLASVGAVAFTGP
ncbi:pectinesterase inhibitor 6-like [Macadamia integrifolia]|uniref:pectinesterase inhibitor 6-like n=1 Tax=Macadamia integrifolia TaxID=60698 RepID=UPI001C4E7BAD|nr:pectinesterase inhibitor 6-like [Macadamia integrifolia]